MRATFKNIYSTDPVKKEDGAEHNLRRAFSAREKTPVELSPTPHDTGFSLFTRLTNSAVACMSCHPEGTDDGHTWIFDIGPRRTQTIGGGILATAPFHWSGDQADVTHLARDVFTSRMGGQGVSDEQTVVLGQWLNAIPAPKAKPVVSEAVSRGLQVFAKAQCGSCHNGASYTNNEMHDVGTGGSFQVPTLLGIGARAPFMHDGCAPTLEARFTNTKCGGTKHGQVDGLSREQIADLVSYLESL